jgi:hypothetical protein
VATTPIDPSSSPQWALAGRVVTMDHDAPVVADGVVWIKNATIAAVTARDQSPPEGFDAITPVSAQP